MSRGLRKRKPVFILTILLVTTSLLFAACGNNGGNGSNGGNKQGNASPSANAANETPSDTGAESHSSLPEVELTWYFPGNFPQPDQNKVFDAVNKVIKSKMNATVNFKPIPFGDYDQKMQVVIASGEAYDLAFTSNWINNYTSNVAKGAFLPLDDLLVQYAPKTFAKVPPTFWEATKVKGKIYGFVNEQISARTPEIAVPQALADKYGFDSSAVSGNLTAFTLNILEPFIQAAKKDHPEKAFISSMTSFADAYNFEAIAGFNVPGVVAYSDDGLKVVNQFKSEEVKAFAATMRDWNAKGYLNAKERISKKSDDWADAKAGKWLMEIGGAFKPGGANLASSLGGEPYIMVPAGTAHLTTGGIVATMHAINRNSKNPERAMMLLELLNTDQELYNLLNFGIKGEHFQIDADGLMVPGDNQKGYNPQVPWMFASNYLAYVEKGMPKTVWEDTKAINAAAIPSKLLGFSFDAEPVKAEISKVSAVFEEYYRAIDLGVASEAKYDEFVAKLDDAGAEKIIAEMQKQIDAWKASK